MRSRTAKTLTCTLLLAWTLWAPPAHAAITLLGSGIFAASTGSDGVTTGTYDTTAGGGATLIVAAVSSYNDRWGSGLVTDNQSNVYTALTKQFPALGSSTSRLFYKNNPTTSTVHTFSVAVSCGACYPDLFVYAFTGTDTTAPFEVENGATATGSPTSIQTGGGVAPAADGAVIITSVSDNLGTGTAQAVNSGFTISTTYGFVGGQHGAGAAAYLIQGAHATVDPTWSSLSGSDAASTIAAFKAAGGGGGPPGCKNGLLLRGAGCEDHP